MWNLELNMRKTKIMIFQKGGKKKIAMFFFGKNRVKQCNEYKYLGSFITNSGTFKQNEVAIRKKGIRASFLITQNVGFLAKTSTLIDIFEKTIEPILTYNSEVTMAYIPKSWRCQKFKEKMWNQGEEINKVTMSFLRRSLGVHKKTTNIALLSEVGKYPIILKVYLNIFKYWIRLLNNPSNLLKEALKINMKYEEVGNLSWSRTVTYLFHVTKTIPLGTDAKIMKNFKMNLEKLFLEWWKSQAVTTGENKLDFYFQHKKNFAFEKYLDNIPRDTRMYLTRLRLSSHCFPIEVQRYKDIERKDRLCDICDLEETGDENHYLLRCPNRQICEVRNYFFDKIKQKNIQFTQLSNKNIIDYCMCMQDINIQKMVAVFILKLTKTYRQEHRVPPLKILCQNWLKKNSLT